MLNLHKVHPEALNELTIELAHCAGRHPGVKYEDVYELARLTIRHRHITETLAFLKDMKVGK